MYFLFRNRMWSAKKRERDRMDDYGGNNSRRQLLENYEAMTLFAFNEKKLSSQMEKCSDDGKSFYSYFRIIIIDIVVIIQIRPMAERNLVLLERLSFSGAD